MDYRELDRQAMKVTGAVISQVRAEHLRRPTPCADWTLHGLMRHLVSEDLGFAAMTTAGTDPSEVDWDAGRLDPDAVTAYHQANAAYLAAFEPDLVLDRRMRVNTFGVLPGSVAVSMHFIDTVVHGWDVAKTLGVPYEPDEEMAGIALETMKRFPSQRPTPSFAVQVPVADDASNLAKLIAYVGRDPDWS